MSKNLFTLKSRYKPAGDQPKAIKELESGLKRGLRMQTLLGVTGSGKTFTMANVIAKWGKPALVIAHNKTLAAQLVQEYREFFPENEVHYFVSYYDFYQPEAYMPVTDTYIEKEAMINEEIDRLRHAATQALLTRRDVIVVATVSCIYGLGSPVEYEEENLRIEKGKPLKRSELIRKLVGMHFTRTNADLSPGMFRAVGISVEIMPVNERIIMRIDLEGDVAQTIERIDAVTRELRGRPENMFLFPAKHFVTRPDQLESALGAIRTELAERLRELNGAGKILEAERLKRRTNYDLALIREIGYCNGIENYSRHFSRRSAGEPPDTLLSYFPLTPDGSADFLTIIDESHVTVPQISGMYAGDASRKQTLVEHGFRLPSARDNRPLTFDEFDTRVGQIVFTSATPGSYERDRSQRVVEQVIRPTGLVDPEVTVRAVRATSTYEGQVRDFIAEAELEVEKGGRIIATTLTKKMAEELAEYLTGKGLSTRYLHSSIKTIERIEILTEFRKGVFDCLVGVNLLREGLDLPEVTLIGILDADKEGFLRSETSLIQTIGRAARNAAGRVILYADSITGSIERAMKETSRRRELQATYNRSHGITPQTIHKEIKDITDTLESKRKRAIDLLLETDLALQGDPRALIRERKIAMNDAVKELDFETAALLRDEIRAIERKVSGK